MHSFRPTTGRAASKEKGILGMDKEELIHCLRMPAYLKPYTWCASVIFLMFLRLIPCTGQAAAFITGKTMKRNCLRLLSARSCREREELSAKAPLLCTIFRVVLAALCIASAVKVVDGCYCAFTVENVFGMKLPAASRWQVAQRGAFKHCSTH